MLKGEMTLKQVYDSVLLNIYNNASGEFIFL